MMHMEKINDNVLIAIDADINYLMHYGKPGQKPGVFGASGATRFQSTAVYAKYTTNPNYAEKKSGINEKKEALKDSKYKYKSSRYSVRSARQMKRAAKKNLKKAKRDLRKLEDYSKLYDARSAVYQGRKNYRALKNRLRAAKVDRRLARNQLQRAKLDKADAAKAFKEYRKGSKDAFIDAMIVNGLSDNWNKLKATNNKFQYYRRHPEAATGALRNAFTLMKSPKISSRYAEAYTEMFNELLAEIE